MEKLFETEMTVGSDHKIVLDLPPESAQKKVHVVVEVKSSVPSRKEILTWPIRRELPPPHPCPNGIPSWVFEPLSEEESRFWEKERI